MNLTRQDIEEERIQPFIKKKDEGFIRKAASEKVFQDNKEQIKPQG